MSRPLPQIMFNLSLRGQWMGFIETQQNPRVKHPMLTYGNGRCWFLRCQLLPDALCLGRARQICFRQQQKISGLYLPSIIIRQMLVVSVVLMGEGVDQRHNTVEAQIAVNLCESGNPRRIGDAAGFNQNMLWARRLVHHLR